MRTFILAAITGATLTLGAAEASAMPVTGADALGAQARITRVAQGCGPGFHRGPYGGCRPNYGRPFYGPRPAYGPRCFVRPTPFGPRRVCRY